MKQPIDLKSFKKLATTSNTLPSIAGDLFMGVVERCNRISGSYSQLICDVSITAEYCLLAEVKKNSCGRYGVFVDATILLQLLIVFSRLLGHPRVLEDIKPIPVEFETSALLLLEKPPRKVTEGVTEVPQLSGARSEASVFLSILAMDFLFMHEVGHIDGRHCDYLYSDTILLIDPSIRRGFEHLADWFALRDCLARASHDPRQFRLLGFSIGVTWELLGLISSRKKTDMRYYPSPVTRSFICEGMASTQFEAEPSIKENVARGIGESRAAWKGIGWPLIEPPPAEDATQAIDDIAISRRQSVHCKTFLRCYPAGTPELVGLEAVPRVVDTLDGSLFHQCTLPWTFYLP